jgi:hypothetical protein
MSVVVTDRDANTIDADAIVVPVDATLRQHRRLADRVLSACDPAVAESLGRLADVAFMGLPPGTLLRLPAVGHPHVGQLLLLVRFDSRDGGAVEADEARLQDAARALVDGLATLGLARVVVTNVAGRTLDAGEVAATIVAAARQAALPTTLVFCDTDPVIRHDMGAAIESLGVAIERA